MQSAVMAFTLGCISLTFLFLILDSALCANHICTYSRSTTEYYTYSVSQKYYTSCGLFGWSRCTRHRNVQRGAYRTKTVYYSDCCNGWRRSSSGQCDDPICSPGCQNGGTCYWPNTCRCIDQYYDETAQCRYRCPLIANCKLEKCTKISDNVCQECKSRRGPTQIAFELDPQQKSCLSRCSWLNNWCWPGYCTGSFTSPDVCTCAPGYSSPPKCDKITEKPVIVLADTSMEDNHSHFANASYLHGKPQQQSTFTNLAPVKILVSITAKFIGPQIGSGTFTTTRFLTDYRNFTKPPWISNNHVGVKGVTFKVWKRTEAGADTTLTDQPMTCKFAGAPAAISSLNSKSPVDCSTSVSLNGIDFLNNEKLFAQVNVENGGFVAVYDYDTKITTYHYYTGSTASFTAQFNFDKAPPIHCSTDSRFACDPGVTADDILSVGPYAVRHDHISAHWNGWVDSPGGSGINAYFLDVFEIVEKGSTHLGEKAAPVNHFEHSSNARRQDFDLRGEGLYSIVLTVKDFAGNTRRARRIILYVKNSTVEVDSLRPLRFPSSVATVSGNRWKTITNGKILIDWTSHYYNTFLVNHQLLKPVNPFHVHIDSGYDHETITLNVTGVPPLPLLKIKSFDGIVAMRYSVTYGVNSQQPSDSAFISIMDNSNGTVLQQHFVVPTNTRDGDNIFVWLMAVDAFGETIIDKALLNIDSSQPEISDLWLTKDGVTKLTFLNSTFFHHLSFEFMSDDPHSSLASIMWYLGDKPDGKSLGTGRVKIRPPSKDKCLSGNCSCIVLGLCNYFTYAISANPSQFSNSSGIHGRFYYLTVNAINDAGLTGEEVFKFAIDDSKPKAGEVLDNFKSMNDIDYQQELTIVASWNGFSDQDSGIHHFDYAVSHECVTDVSRKVFTQTTETSSQLVKVSPGKYFTTVVAYNNAMEPSAVTCSDGVTVDITPPQMKELVVQNARSKQGLIQEKHSSKIWLIDHFRRRLGVLKNSPCSAGALQVNSISVYPLKSSASENTTLNTCAGPSSPVFYTAVNRFVDSSWTVIDSESGIHDYEIGIGRSANEDPPSYASFFSTKGHNSFSNKVNTLGIGEEFYVILKASNKAGMDATWAVGPIIVDTTPPHFSGTIDAARKQDFVEISWQKSAFTDPEQTNEELDIAIGAGTAKGADDALTLAPMDSFRLCSTNSTTCIAVNSTLLQDKAAGHDALYFIVISSNRAGLSVTGVSAAYVHHAHPPAPGIVFDLSPNDGEARTGNSPDVDYQDSLHELRCRWSGFSPSDTLLLGVGSASGQDDVIAFHKISSDQEKALFTNLTLSSFSVYYVTVIASNSAGFVTVTSDGVRVLGKQIRGNVFDGTGCLGGKHSLSEFQLKDPSQCTYMSKDFIGVNTSRANEKNECHLSVLYDTLPGQTYTFSFESAWITTPEKFSNLSMRNETVWAVDMTVNNDKIAVPLWNQSEQNRQEEWKEFSAEITAHSSQTEITLRYFLQSGERVSGTASKARRLRNFKFEQCENDIDFQSSAKEIAAHWSVDSAYNLYVTRYKWEVLHQTSIGLSAIKVDSEKGFSHQGKMAVQLQPGSLYKIAVQPCTPLFCFDPIFSDGLQIMNTIPVTGVASASLSSTPTRNFYKISASWKPFRTVSQSGKPTAVIFYQWTLTTPSSPSSPLIKWQQVSLKNRSLNAFVQLNATVLLTITKSRTVFLFVKGYSQVGLSPSLRIRLTVPHYDDIERISAVVIDVLPSRLISTVSPLTGRLERATLRQTDDIDYSKSLNEIAAAWLWNKEGLVSWVLVKDVPSWQNCDMALKCGATNSSFVSLKNINLSKNSRYFFCIKFDKIEGADRRDLKVLGHVICSDGLTVDNSPPQPGKVVIGSAVNGRRYQSFDDTVLVQWRGFSDVEEEDAALHDSGIQTYCIALGTKPLGVDMIPFRCIGHAEHFLLTNLSLESGKTYYATVKAVDHVGLESRAVSDSLTCDTSPPVIGSISIQGEETGHITKAARSSWQGFGDPESGIDYYEWCIGSSPKLADVIRCSTTKKQFFEFSSNLLDGHLYFVTVKAVNKAGLESKLSTHGYVYDSSPPFGGIVLDGNLPEKDMDYQADLGSLSAQWHGFYDPHSGLSHYSIGIGTEKESSDIVPYYNVGLLTDFSVSGLSLFPGARYFITVEACNGVGQCTKVTSDGLIIDQTPPLPGVVWDGMHEGDAQFQAVDDVIGAKWFGFQDPQSSISYYEWCAGTAVGSDDVVPWTKTFKEETGIAPINSNMPKEKRIFSTVKAHNHAGMWTLASSNGFFIDSTPPFVVKTPRFDLGYRSLLSKTQFSRSLLVASWEFDDKESPVISHVVSITTHRNITPAVNPIHLGSETSVSISRPNISLQDGFHYYLSVTSCNEARLCTHYASTEGLFIDTSAPLTGVFVDPMKWNANVLSITWRGFSDIHSGIMVYVLTVGTKYSGTDVVSNLTLSHVGSEDALQTASANVGQPIQPGKRFFVSLWATNGVDLRSDQIQVSVVAASSVGNSGVLFIERHSCPVENCAGDCTCAAVHNLCNARSFPLTCSEINSSMVPADSIISVYDSLSYVNDHPVQASDSSLVGSWKKSSNSPSWPLERIQFSAGTLHEPGEDVFDRNEDRIWYEAGDFNQAVILLKPYMTLSHRTTYAIYVRVWYSGSRFALFKSRGVTIDTTPPAMKRAVLDVTPYVDGDADFTTNNTYLKVSWARSFLDAQSGIVNYRIAFGTKPHADDVTDFQVVNPSVYFLEYFGSLQNGQRYFGTVQAFNVLGLLTSVSTDGIVVDTENPFSGVVLDGDQQTDRQFQDSVSTFTANWHGFFDRHSAIEYYEFGIGDTPGFDNVVSLHSIGLRLLKKSSNLNLVDGKRYYATVIAHDAAGLKSKPVTSDGVTVDMTPPRLMACDDFGVNVFASFTGLVNSTLSTGKNVGDWNVTSGKATILGGDNGNVDVLLSGSISQEYDFASNLTYKLVVFGEAVGGKRSQQLHVVAPGMHRTLLVDRGRTMDGRYTVYFDSDASGRGMVELRAVSSSNNLIRLSSVQLFSCQKQHTSYSPSFVSNASVFFSSPYLSPAHILEVHWNMFDSESGIKEYFWAVGTVKGGQQLVPYTSTGLATYARFSVTEPAQGSDIYVTILGTNKAGLTTKLEAQSIKVDYTPPFVSVQLVQSLIHGDADQQYVTGNRIGVSWNGTEDRESGIDYCEWGLGLAPGSTELHPYQKADRSTMTAFATVTSLKNGHLFYISVRCRNFANLEARNSSAGIYFITSPPSESTAFVKTPPAASAFDTTEGYQIDNSTVNFSWGGFDDPTQSITHYEVSVNGPSVSTGWINVGRYSQARIGHLNMSSGSSYTLSVRAINVANVASRAVVSAVKIVQQKPRLTGTPITGHWTDGNNVVLSWVTSFSSDSDLKFEVSLGSRQGSSDLMQWKETKSPSISVEVGPVRELFVTVTAFNPVGLSETTTSVIARP